MDEKDQKYLLKLADKNLADSIKHRVENIEGGKLYETDNYIIYTIGIDNEDGHLNGALCLNDKYAEEMFSKAEEFFSPLKRNYSVWVRAHEDYNLERILKEKGLEPKRQPGSAGMIIRNRIETVDLPPGFGIRRVKTNEDIKDFIFVIKDAFDKPDEVGERMFSKKATLFASNVMSFLIYKGNKPISAAMTVVSEDVSGIYYVGTIESGRGLGLGSYIVQESTNAGFDAGSPVVILQASAAGERVYTKLGYEKITYYRSYIREF